MRVVDTSPLSVIDRIDMAIGLGRAQPELSPQEHAALHRQAAGLAAIWRDPFFPDAPRPAHCPFETRRARTALGAYMHAHTKATA